MLTACELHKSKRNRQQSRIVGVVLATRDVSNCHRGRNTDSMIRREFLDEASDRVTGREEKFSSHGESNDETYVATCPLLAETRRASREPRLVSPHSDAGFLATNSGAIRSRV